MASAHKTRRALLPAALGVILVFPISSCANDDEQAIRHVVVAEFIQRERLPESHVETQFVRFLSGQKAVAVARVLGLGGRADTWRKSHFAPAAGL